MHKCLCHSLIFILIHFRSACFNYIAWLGARVSADSGLLHVGTQLSSDILHCRRKLVLQVCSSGQHNCTGRLLTYCLRGSEPTG